MKNPLTTTLLLSATLSAAAQAPASEIDFDWLAETFREERCAADACDVDAVLAAHYAHVRIGAFDVHYPTALLSERDGPAELQEVLAGMVDLQAAWIERLGTTPGAIEGAQTDLATVREWIEGWRTKELKKLGKKGGAHDLVQVCEAPDEVLAAEGRLWDLLHDGERLALPMMPDRTTRLILAPTRLDFMQWVAFAGQVEPERRGSLYVDGVDQWTQIWTGWTPVLAMEYAAWTDFDPKFRSGKSMKSFEKSGLVEQITLQAGMALVRYCVGRDLGHPDNAIVMNMVIEIAGQLNTIDGEGQIGTTGAKTQAYSRFVPGGNSSGGTLPKRSAAGLDAVKKSRWREDNGADYFFAVLAEGQKDGGKQARKERKERYKDELAHFQLKSDRGKYVVSAPFFGKHAAEQPYPPQEFLTDYGEFYRAYKSAFFHWLRWYGAGDAESPEASTERFRELLGELDDLRDGKTFADAVLEVYGVPWSAADGETDSLEWRFLAFLEGGSPVVQRR